MAAQSLAMKSILFGWGAFTGTHLALSHTPVRDWFINTFGEKPFLAGYSAVSLGTLAPAVYGYMIGRGRGPVVHNLGNTVYGQYGGAALKWSGFFMVAQAWASPAPSSLSSRKGHALAPSSSGHDSHGHGEHKSEAHQQHVEVTGVHRISRHPLSSGIALWAAGCMLQRGHLIDLVFWGAIPAVYLLTCAHQDLRYSELLPREYWRDTSLLPFGAVLSGHQDASKAWEEISTMSLRLTLFGGILFLALRGRLRREYWYPTRAYKAW